jgi:hypothetical protein
MAIDMKIQKSNDLLPRLLFCAKIVTVTASSKHRSLRRSASFMTRILIHALHALAVAQAVVSTASDYKSSWKVRTNGLAPCQVPLSGRSSTALVPPGLWFRAAILTISQRKFFVSRSWTDHGQITSPLPDMGL